MASVRPCELDDRDAVWDLLNQLARTIVPDKEAFSATLPQIIEDSEELLLVHEGPAGVDGYVLASTHRTLYANTRVCWVAELVVDEAARHAGVGSTLMGAAIAWAGERGCSLVTLATSRAKVFYQGIGFQEAGEHLRLRIARDGDAVGT